MPPGVEIKLLNKEFSYFAPGLREPIRVTTDPDFYEENPESVEFWTQGNPLFPSPAAGDQTAESTSDVVNLNELLT